MPQSGYQIVAAIMAGINARAGGRSRSTLQRLRQKKRLAQLRGVLRRLAEGNVAFRQETSDAAQHFEHGTSDAAPLVHRFRRAWKAC